MVSAVCIKTGTVCATRGRHPELQLTPKYTKLFNFRNRIQRPVPERNIQYCKLRFLH